MTSFFYALVIVVTAITALGFIVAGIEVFLAIKTDYVPFIELAKDCPNVWQGGAFIVSGIMAAALMGIAWIAWNDEVVKY